MNEQLTPNEQLLKCASKEDIEGMREAVKMGATDFDRILCWTAGERKIKAMCELKKMGATDFYQALRLALKGGHREAMNHLKKMKVIDSKWYLELLREGDSQIYYKKIKVVELLCKWIKEEKEDE